MHLGLAEPLAAWYKEPVKRRRILLLSFVLGVGFRQSVPASPAPAPLPQSPAPGALNVDPDTRLTWRWVDELIANGSFESGLTPGWYVGGSNPEIWYIHTDSTNAYGMGYRWASTFMPYGYQASGQLMQDVFIPADATSATLRWSERITNGMPYYFPVIGRLSVQLYQDHLPVVTLHNAYGGEPEFLSYNWVTRTTNLLAYAGQIFQLVVEADGYPPYGQNWRAELDGFSLACEYSSALPEFLVFLGKTSALGPTNQLGDTTALSLAPPALDSLTTYYWRVGAVRDGVTNFSATAQFTTGQRILPALTVTGVTSTSVHLSFPSRTDRYYAIEQLDALDGTASWYEILWAGQGSGTPMEVEVPVPGGSAAFWRLRVSQ